MSSSRLPSEAAAYDTRLEPLWFSIMTLSVHDQLTQLEKARQIVLGNSTLYSQIVQGILPIVGANSRVELRRWGADFLAETFASPLLGTQQKEDLSIVVLQTLRELLELPGQDNNVIKSVVQAAASVYSLVFHYMYVLSLHPFRRSPAPILVLSELVRP